MAHDEAMRLLEQRLHVRGKAGAVTVLEEGASWLLLVPFANPTDTIAEVRVDRCSGAITTSSIGGGL